MKILFLHQNFPGQFAHLAPALAAKGHHVVALTSRFEKSHKWRGVDIVAYKYDLPKDTRHHPWLNNMNRSVDRGFTVFRAAERIKAAGFMPDVIVAHSGWGEAMFIRDVWPTARIGVFCEFWYLEEGADLGFDPEFVKSGLIGESARLRMRNLPQRLQMESAQQGISPTQWQASLYPEEIRRKINVIFDGIDTNIAIPNQAAQFDYRGLRLTRQTEVITFINRNLEPYRGFHIFMRALPKLLARRPHAQIVVVGADGVSYGSPPENGGTWREQLTAEIKDQMTPADWDRVHFVGKVPYNQFLALMQISRVHLYLTYPFVLSWSLMESMAMRCAIVASDTAPVKEVITDGVQGLLTDFFDTNALVDRVDQLASDPELRRTLGRAAREKIMEEYDLASVCLPRQFEWVANLAQMRAD